MKLKDIFKKKSNDNQELIDKSCKLIDHIVESLTVNKGLASKMGVPCIVRGCADLIQSGEELKVILNKKPAPTTPMIGLAMMTYLKNTAELADHALEHKLDTGIVVGDVREEHIHVAIREDKPQPVERTIN